MAPATQMLRSLAVGWTFVDMFGPNITKINIWINNEEMIVSYLSVFFKTYSSFYLYSLHNTHASSLKS